MKRLGVNKISELLISLVRIFPEIETITKKKKISFWNVLSIIGHLKSLIEIFKYSSQMSEELAELSDSERNRLHNIVKLELDLESDKTEEIIETATYLLIVVVDLIFVIKK